MIKIPILNMKKAIYDFDVGKMIAARKIKVIRFLFLDVFVTLILASA